MTDFTCSLRSLVCGLVLAGSISAFADEGSLGFSVSNITVQDATVTTIPSSDDLTYYWNFMDKETFEAKGGAEKVIENRIAIWERNASYYDNTTWQEMMGYELVQGSMTESLGEYFYETLMYGTDYVVYGFGMDRDGNVTAPVSTVEFTTKEPSYSDNTFEVSVTSIVKGSFYYTATAHIEPSNSDRYMVRFFTKEFVDKFDITPGSTGEKRFIAEEMLYYLEDDEMANGPHDFSYTRCRESFDYYVVVMGINEDETPSTSLTMVEFTAVETKAPVQGSIELEVSDITPMNAHIRITPSDDDIRYYFNITTPDIIEMKGGVDKIPEKLIIDWWKFLAEIYGGSMKWQDFIPMQTTQGSIDDTVANLVEQGELEDLYWNTDWVLYAVGFDLDGNIITEPAVLEFHTPDCGTSDMTFEYEFVSAEPDPDYSTSTRKYYMVTVDIYPSDDDETFRVNYMQTKYYDQYLEDPEPDMFDFITRQFLPSSVEFNGPVRLQMPAVPATSIFGEQLEWGVFCVGWNEGPTTDVSVYRFTIGQTGADLNTENIVSVKTNAGTLTIEGMYDRATIYSLDGRVAGGLIPGHSITLAEGVYIVNYSTLDGVQHTEKVIVK